MVSGLSTTDRVSLAQEMGAGKFIKKPYSMQILGKAIREALAETPEQMPVKTGSGKVREVTVTPASHHIIDLREITIGPGKNRQTVRMAKSNHVPGQVFQRGVKRLGLAGQRPAYRQSPERGIGQKSER